jgi:hypothetical protein
VAHHLRPIYEIGTQHIRADQRVGKIDRRSGCDRADQEGDQPRRAGIRPEQVPVPVHDDRRKGFLLAEYMVEGARHAGHVRRGEVALSPFGRVACGQQQRVVLP